MITQEQMVAALLETRRETQAVLDRVGEMDTIVHTDSGWRMRDVAGHLTAWDVEAGKALHAHAGGDSYRSPGRDIEGFNAARYEHYSVLTLPALLDAFTAAHEGFVAALRELPEEAVDRRIDLPWSGRDSVTYLVRVMVSHADRHRIEIRESVA